MKLVGQSENLTLHNVFLSVTFFRANHSHLTIVDVVLDEVDVRVEVFHLFFNFHCLFPIATSFRLFPR